jgi:hypothetical protein
MLILIFILFVLFVGLTALFWVGTFFFQGYIYLQPTPGLFWKAPAAALLMVLGFATWCFSIALSSGASPQNIPIDTLFRFTPTVDMLAQPARKLWAIKLDRRKSTEQNKDGISIEYDSRRKDQTHFYYEDTKLKKPYDPMDVVAIEIEIKNGEKMRFDLIPAEMGNARSFQSKDGWVIKAPDDRPTGIPERFLLTRLLLNLIFNFGHLFAWFVVLWVVLRFQWAHALGLASVLWAIVTLTLLPILLTQSSYVAAAVK